jgi:hypothetical protein
MTRWVSLEDWKRAKGSVSQQLQEKAGPKVRLGRSIVKRAGKLGVRAGTKWKGNKRGSK